MQQPCTITVIFVEHNVDILILFLDRYEQIGKEFKKKYGMPPQFFIRAPGRVNLIGEAQ